MKTPPCFAVPEGVLLNPAQREVVDAGILDAPCSAVLQMPTGTGKTFLAEMAIRSVLDSGRRAIYLTPLRALAAELLPRWTQRLDPHKVGIFTGEYGAPGKEPYPVPYDEARLYIMTPERLDLVTRTWTRHWGWIPDVDLVVADEIHLLSDLERGPHYEGALSRLRRLNPFTRVLALSATIGNRAELAAWLQGVAHHSQWRTVPQTWRTIRYARPDERPALLRNLLSDTVAQDTQAIVFVQSRKRAEFIAADLRANGIAAEHHHAGVPPTRRRATEARFRAQELPVVIATPTLEMGLNLPARTVILYDLTVYDGQNSVPLPVSAVHQRAGRAGRPGLDTEGHVVLLAHKHDRTVDRYLQGVFEPVISPLPHQGQLRSEILAELSSGLCRTASSLRAALAQSFAAHTRVPFPDIDQCIQAMCAAGMIRQEGDRLEASRSGLVAARHLLHPSTVFVLDRTLQDHTGLSRFDLLLLVCSTQDATPVFPVTADDIDVLAARLPGRQTRLCAQGTEALRKALCLRGRALLSALKMALALDFWIQTGDLQEVCRRLPDTLPNEIDALRESAERLLSASAALAGRYPPGLRSRLSLLRRCVSLGLEPPGASLALLPGVGPSFVRRLRESGFADLGAIATTRPEILAAVPGVSDDRACRWIGQAARILAPDPELLGHDPGPAFHMSPAGWPPSPDPLRLRRALDLTVTPQAQGVYLVADATGAQTVRVGPSPATAACPCPDAISGATCRHILAVRLHGKDPELQPLLRRLSRPDEAPTLDLIRLWHEPPVPREDPL